MAESRRKIEILLVTRESMDRACPLYRIPFEYFVVVVASHWVGPYV